jgi:hypothetical protein
MLRQTCRRTSFTGCLKTFLQITLSDRIEDTHFRRRCASLVVTGVAHTSITAHGVIPLHDLSCFDFEDPDDLVKANSKYTTEEGSEPVNPVIAREVMGCDSGTERACRVQRCSGERTANQLCDKEG